MSTATTSLSESRDRRIRADLRVAAVLLLGSGFSALVYQVLWMRLLGLVFGVTVHAATTVLAAFMAGLALGSFLAGRLSDRVARPRRWFGFAELFIAATALATPMLFDALEGVYAQVYARASGDASILTMVRFLCCAAVLLVPTTLMGATMPLMIRSIAGPSSAFGANVAVLYAANTAGALAGAWLTGYYLISQVGIETSFRIAAAVNLLVAMMALTAAPGLSPSPGDVSTGAEREESRRLPDPVRRLVFTVFIVSGFVGLALEIIWFRALVMFLPATTYVFTIILANVLGGIAAGSAAAIWALRRERDWLGRLAVLQIAIAIAAVASLGAQAWTYSHGWRTGAAIQASALSVLPAMLLMGAAFPVGLACWAAGRADGNGGSGDRVGRFYLGNLSGAIAGAVVSGFVLIPQLGTRRSLIAVAALSLLSGLALLVAVARRHPRFAAGVATAGLLLFTGVSVMMPDPLETVLERRYGGETLLWREEGAQSTVSVHQGSQRVMYLDGLHQTNDSVPMLATHRQIGALAVALHASPRDVLVVGLGGGATAGAAAQFTSASIDIVELSPTVVHGAEWFRHANGDVLRRPHVRMRIDDGRNYLLLTGKKYDVITADIIQPFHAGAGNLYSLEYFQLAARALRDDGVMLQWIGHRPAAQYRLIARTFLAAFPNTTVWANGTLLAGTRRPLRLSEANYRARLEDPAVAAALASQVGTFADLTRLYTAGPEELRRFIGDGPVLTDDRPMVEFFLSLPQEDEDISLAGLRGDVARHVVP